MGAGAQCCHGMHACPHNLLIFDKSRRPTEKCLIMRCCSPIEQRSGHRILPPAPESGPAVAQIWIERLVSEKYPHLRSCIRFVICKDLMVTMNVLCCYEDYALPLSFHSSALQNGARSHSLRRSFVRRITTRSGMVGNRRKTMLVSHIAKTAIQTVSTITIYLHELGVHRLEPTCVTNRPIVVSVHHAILGDPSPAHINKVRSGNKFRMFTFICTDSSAC